MRGWSCCQIHRRQAAMTRNYPCAFSYYLYRKHFSNIVNRIFTIFINDRRVGNETIGFRMALSRLSAGCVVQCRQDFEKGLRLSKVIALPDVAAELPEKLPCFFILDAFRDGDSAQAVG